MSISQEWTKAIHDLRGVYLAIRSSLGSTWAGRSGERSKPRPVHTVATQSTLVSDRSISADLELRKTFALLNNIRTLVR